MKSRQPRGQPGCAEGRIHYLLPPPPLSSYSSGQFEKKNKRGKNPPPPVLSSGQVWKKKTEKKSFTTILRPGLPSNYKSQHKCDNLNFSVYAVSASYYKNRHSGSDQCWLFCYKFALMFCLIANKCVRKQFGFYLGSVPAASIWWILKPHSACSSDLHLHPCAHF